jgi:hypothetical protein
MSWCFLSSYWFAFIITSLRCSRFL